MEKFDKNDSQTINDNTETVNSSKQTNETVTHHSHHSHHHNNGHKNKFHISTKTLTGTAIFVAVEIVLTYISNYIVINSVNINLGLIPVVVSGAVYGPFAGLIVGFINGFVTLISPSTLTFFFPYNGWATALICLAKSSIAGVLGAILYNFIKRKNRFVACIITSLTVPLTNTLLFLLGAYAFFLDIYAPLNVNGVNIYVFILTSILINFAVELLVNVVICPMILKTIHTIKKRNAQR